MSLRLVTVIIAGVRGSDRYDRCMQHEIAYRRPA
jgi:hypothetical protein